MSTDVKQKTLDKVINMLFNILLIYYSKVAL